MRWQAKKKQILKDLDDILYDNEQRRDYSALLACVKIYNFGGWDHEIPAELEGIVAEDDFDKNGGWNYAVEEDWWYMVENHGNDFLNFDPRLVTHFTFVPEGRSAGWLCASEWNSGTFSIGLKEDKADILKAAKDLPREYLEEFHADVVSFHCNKDWIYNYANAFFTDEINRHRKNWLNDIAAGRDISIPFPE